MLEADGHLIGALLQPEDIGNQSGIIVPKTLFAINESIAKGFEITEFRIYRLAQANDEAGLSGIFT